MGMILATRIRHPGGGPGGEHMDLSFILNLIGYGL